LTSPKQQRFDRRLHGSAGFYTANSRFVTGFTSRFWYYARGLLSAFEMAVGNLKKNKV
jgi:hypothetical protein